MSVPYAESFSVNGINLGIEDLQDGLADHFMPERQTQRFHLWCGGSGVGSADTLPEARELLYKFVVQRLDAEIAKYQAALIKNTTARLALGTNDYAKIMQFITKGEK